jgi:tRNA pseudouridine(38-40) synthase
MGAGGNVHLLAGLEYDGTGFAGWAMQPGLRTVEGVLREALSMTFQSWNGLAVAGRTDAGVHASGQIVSVSVKGGPPAQRAAAALNTVLPHDVAVTYAEAAPESFHARFSARSRTYRYRIWQRRTPSPLEHRRSWWVPRRLDDERLGANAGLVVARCSSADGNAKEMSSAAGSPLTASSVTWSAPSWERWSRVSLTSSNGCSRVVHARRRA